MGGVGGGGGGCTLWIGHERNQVSYLTPMNSYNHSDSSKLKMVQWEKTDSRTGTLPYCLNWWLWTCIFPGKPGEILADA